MHSQRSSLVWLVMLLPVSQAIARPVPPDSVLPAWTETLSRIVGMAKRGFSDLSVAPDRSGPVTDAELANGARLVFPQKALLLQGADDCVLQREAGRIRYMCRFYTNETADEARGDYVRLVRLVENSAHGIVNRRPGNPSVLRTGPSDFRSAVVDVAGLYSGITVEESFSPGSAAVFEVRLDGQETASLPQATTAVPPDINVFQIIAAVARIEVAPHRDLRPVQAGSGVGPVTIDNGSAASIAVYLSGPSTQRVLIGPHASARVTASPGSYKIAVETTDDSAAPLFGVHSWSGGARESLYSEGK